MKNKDNTAQRCHYVDLGLPSGTLWADRNVGAKNVKGCGFFFQWGSINGYDVTEAEKHSSPENCPSVKYGENGLQSAEWDKANTDNQGNLLPTADGAHIMCSSASMPTQRQWEELINETTREIQNHGITLTSRHNGNSIFIPLVGWFNWGFKVNEDKAYLWTSTKSDEEGYAKAAYLDYNFAMFEKYCQRDWALPIRGIKNTQDDNSTT